MACKTKCEFFAEAGTLVVLPTKEKGEGMFENKEEDRTDRGVVISKGEPLNFELAVPKAVEGDTVIFGDYAGKDFLFTHAGDKEPTTYKTIAFGEAKVTIPKSGTRP